MTTHHPRVDDYFNTLKNWRSELSELRTIVLKCGLDEDFKWGKPCYMVGKSNVIALAALKDYCWIMFFKGAAIADPAGLLTKAGENSQSMRIVRFATVKDVRASTAKLVALINAAIEIEKAGIKIQFKSSAELVFPPEFVNCLDGDAKLQKSFENLTPGRKRGYHILFSSAKQAKTLIARIEKSIPRILMGKGIDDT